MPKLKTKEEREFYHKYHIANTTNIYTCKINAVMINTHNGIKHEMKKLQVCYEIKKLGSSFITEAERNKKRGEERKIVDVVDLSARKEIEIIDMHENDFQIQKYRAEGIIPVIVNPMACEKCGLLFPERNKKHICQVCNALCTNL